MSLTHHLSLSGWGVVNWRNTFVDRVERLGVVTCGLGADPLSLVGLVAPVIGSGIAPTWLSLSMVAGVVTLVRRHDRQH